MKRPNICSQKVDYIDWPECQSWEVNRIINGWSNLAQSITVGFEMNYRPVGPLRRILRIKPPTYHRCMDKLCSRNIETIFDLFSLFFLWLT